MSELTEPGRRQSVLVVDDTAENIDVLKGILSEHFIVRAATSGPLALRIVQRHPPDLILLDVMMPEMDGFEVCRRIKSDPESAHIPVVFVTAKSEAEAEQQGFAVGGVDYLTKPVNPALTLARVRTQLSLADQRLSCQRTVQSRTAELEAAQKAAVYMLGDAGHYNDTDTGVHIWRMAAYSAALARAAHWPVAQAHLLELAAPMHDTGKIGIPDKILKAPRKLTAEEWEVMKTHTEIGHRILSMSQTDLFQMAAEVAKSHHEHWDGSGYPEGLTSEQIPESARIVAIADVFDALTMRRPYKEAWSADRAFATLQEDAGTHFDPRMVKLFLSISDEILEIKAEWDTKEKESQPDA